MYDATQAITEYEYILHALDEGVSVQDIREELSRMESMSTITDIHNSSPAKGFSHAIQF